MDPVIVRAPLNAARTAPRRRADHPGTMQPGGPAMPELNVFLHSHVEQLPGAATGMGAVR